MHFIENAVKAVHAVQREWALSQFITVTHGNGFLFCTNTYPLSNQRIEDNFTGLLTVFFQGIKLIYFSYLPSTSSMGNEIQELILGDHLCPTHNLCSLNGPDPSPWLLR